MEENLYVWINNFIIKNAKGMSSLVDQISEPLVVLRCAIKNGYADLIRNRPTSFDGDPIGDKKEYEEIIRENLKEYDTCCIAKKSNRNSL